MASVFIAENGWFGLALDSEGLSEIYFLSLLSKELDLPRHSLLSTCYLCFPCKTK